MPKKKNDEFANMFHCIGFAYDRGFQFGYLVAKLGTEWPGIPASERRPYENEAKDALKRWTEACDKFREVQS